LAASYGNSTSYSSARGNADFGGLSKLARAEGVLFGITALNTFMQVITELEQSLNHCKQSCRDGYCIGDGHLRPLDKAIAYFCGSLAEDGREEGLMIYSLARKRDNEFHPAQAQSKGARDQLAKRIVDVFGEAQGALLQGDCENAKARKEAIVDLMKVPLVQSLLRYAYVREMDEFSSNLEREKAQAFGATYAAATLPYIHACNEGAAKVIYESMRYGSGKPSFSQVKSTVESVYQCMNIQCEDVGGLWVQDSYAEGAQPCTTSSLSKTSNEKDARRPALAIMMVFAIVGLIAFLFFRKKNTRERRFSTRSNIAAVSDIA